MVKVMIADDEEWVCRLIQALVDWEEAGLSLVGTAHNGVEAIEMVRQYHPDILITDIRMPGCSGLELIEQAKAGERDLEIVIISGYAQFDYAQQAIKFGVSDYLLKPINRAELNATLKKLKERVCQRRSVEQDREEQIRKAKNDIRYMRENLVERLIRQEDPGLTMEVLRETYHLEVKPGYFQAFWLKMDCGKETVGEASTEILMEKAKEVLERGVRGKCAELVLAVRGLSCIGIMNYEKERREEVRQGLKSCLNQIEMQKSLFRPVTFSMALGSACGTPGRLGGSVKEASVMIQERIVRGTGRMFERMPENSALQKETLLQRYLQEVTRAAETLNLELARGAVRMLALEIRNTKDVRGYEIMELVQSAAEVFAACMQLPERQELLARFSARCAGCGKTEEILDCLLEFQEEQMNRALQQQENDSVRPIRKAKQYIQTHYSEPITQEEISGIVGLSPAYFSALFKKTEGEGFAKYLINVRMEQAKILLRETNESVAEICRKVGYNDLKHFTHTFEKATGVKPATYRKLYG